MLPALNPRLKGYLVATATGVALGLIVDAIDIERLIANRAKIIHLSVSIGLIITALVSAYDSPPLSSQDKVPSKGLDLPS